MGPNATVKTVRVKSTDTESGFIVINESDFKPTEHELFVEGEDGGNTEKTLDQMTTKKAVIEYAAKAVPGFEVVEGKVADMKAAVQAEFDKRNPKE